MYERSISGEVNRLKLMKLWREKDKFKNKKEELLTSGESTDDGGSSASEVSKHLFHGARV
jgi:hypothetical protein